MRKLLCKATFFIVVSSMAVAASKPHVITFGKWTAVKEFVGSGDDKTVDTKVRPLCENAKLKEYTLGTPHEITERLFSVRRAVRINDALPQEAGGSPRWVWQPGGWLLVDRATGHIAEASLPDFDPYASSVSWYRDYAAYCGVSDDGRKLEALVVQAGKRKAVLKNKIGDGPAGNEAEAACGEPEWQRNPIRVTFTPKGGDKQTYTIRGRAAAAAKEEPDDEAEE